MKIQRRTDASLLEERIYLRILAEVESERLLKKYVNESLICDLLPYIEEDIRTIQEKWSVLESYFNSRHLLTEGQIYKTQLLIESAWEGLKSFAAKVGKKIVDGSVWFVKKAAKVGAKAMSILKKIGDKVKDIIIFSIKQLPGGEIVLDFLSNIATKLEEKIKEMQAAIGKKIEEFVNSAKKKIVDFFFEYVLTDPELKADVIAALGLKENMFRGKPLLKEDSIAAQKLIADKLGLPDPEKTKDVIDVLQGKSEDSVETLRDVGADVIDKLITFWLKLVEKNPKKYHEPFFKSGFFKPLGTGFGLAASAFLGILASGQLSWNALVRYITSIIRGFEGGMSRPSGAQTDYAGAYLFLGNKSNNYDASLFKDFITGIIRGSNLETITRVLAGDVTKIPDLVKKILGTIIIAVKEAINAVTKKVIQGVEDDPIDDDTEEQVNDAIGDYIDEMFAGSEG